MSALLLTVHYVRVDCCDVIGDIEELPIGNTIIRPREIAGIIEA